MTEATINLTACGGILPGYEFLLAGVSAAFVLLAFTTRNDK
jgi:hypothetical protein